MKYIDKIGVELEGAWHVPPSGMYEDGSIDIGSHDCNYCNVCEDCDSRDYCEENDIIPTENRCCDNCSQSNEGEVSACFLSLETLFEWVHGNYPDTVNSTCGMHIHLSFKSMLYYSYITDNRFYKYFLKSLSSWADGRITSNDFWARLNGNNSYCYKDFSPFQQLYSNHSRYTQVNFAAFNKHGTIEFRLLPMFNYPETGCKAISAVTNITEKYIQNKRKEKVLRKVLVI